PGEAGAGPRRAHGRPRSGRPPGAVATQSHIFDDWYNSDMNMAVSQAREEWPELVTLVHYRNERVLLLRHGKPVAALISAEDLELLEQLEDAADVRAAKEALADPENQGPPIPWEEL